MTTQNWLYFFICAVNFASFFWSVFGVFKKHPDQNKLAYISMALMSMAMWTSSLWLIADSPLSFSLALFGILIQVFAAILFWSARRATNQQKLTIVFSQDVPRFIVLGGPYRWVRHPFYTSYILSYASVALVLWNPISFALAIVMVLFYFFASRAEEAKFSNSPLSADYNAYKAKTGAFFPVKVLSSRKDGPTHHK